MWSRMQWPWMAAVVTSLFVSVSLAEDRVVVQVTPGASKAFSIGVQRFLDDIEPATGNRTLDLRVTTEEALAFGGSVLPLDRAAYLAPEETRELAGRFRVDCIDWTQSGADGLVEGRLTSLGDRWRVEYQVWDTARCQNLKSGHVEAPRGEIRRLGKEVADQVAAAFTGIRGASNTEIAFISDRSGRRELYVMEADGSNLRAATQNRAIKSFPNWYRDGKAVVYTSHYDGQQPGLALSSRGGLTPGPFLGAILPGAPKYRGVFNPAGDALAFVSSVDSAAEIFSVGRDGQQLQRLTHSPAIEISPSWSPDGKLIAFVSDRSGSPQIYVMHRDGRGARRLTFQGSYNTGPVWSPDGRWIAYETRLESQFDIWLIDPSGDLNFPLVQHPRSDETPSWSPDSRKLVFSSNRRGRADLYMVDVDGGSLQRLTRGEGDNIQPSWGPFLQ